MTISKKMKGPYERKSPKTTAHGYKKTISISNIINRRAIRKKRIENRILVSPTGSTPDSYGIIFTVFGIFGPMK
jgi:hypothetical protein